MKSITIGKKAILWVIVLSIIVGTAIATATYLVGEFKIGYRIEPITSEAVTLNPNPISLDLGTLPSGSTGTIDFGNSCRLSLSAGYDIGFELDVTTISDFSSFQVWVRVYDAGTTHYNILYLDSIMNPRWITLDAGDYDMHIEIEYDAEHVTEVKAGEIKISISY